MKTITITIDKATAEVQVTTQGFTGPNCVKESQFIKDALGQTIATQLTPAYLLNEEGETIKAHLPLCG
jgi:hypothetical protein